MFHSLVLSIFTELCNYHHYLILENCHQCQRNLVPISSQSWIYPPVPHPLTITNLLSGTIDLPILGIVYKWDHKISGLLCLPFFSSVGIILPRSTYIGQLLHSYLQLRIAPLNMPHLFNRSLTEVFPLLASMKNTAYKHPCTNICLNTLNMYSRVDCQGHMVTVCLAS